MWHVAYTLNPTKIELLVHIGLQTTKMKVEDPLLLMSSWGLTQDASYLGHEHTRLLLNHQFVTEGRSAFEGFI